MRPARPPARLRTVRKEAIDVPAELRTSNGQTLLHTAPAASDAELRRWARPHAERVRRLKLHAVAFVLGMAVLTPVWVLVEWQDNGGFERWSGNGNPGDWEPWVLYAAGIWLLVLSLMAFRLLLDRPATEAEVERELERVRRR
jgi:hypothetical protein